MFWKRKYDNPDPGKVTNWLARSIVICQIKFANSLNRFTGSWNVRQQKLFLGGFLLVMCCLILVQIKTRWGNRMLFNKPNAGIPSLITPVVPRHSAPIYSAQDSSVLKQFRLRIEQLQTTEKGRDSLRQFEALRPGFIDSVIRVERQLFHKK